MKAKATEVLGQSAAAAALRDAIARVARPFAGGMMLAGEPVTAIATSRPG